MQGRRVSGGAIGREPHPVDELIRELVRTRRSCSEDEIQRIRERLSTAPFSRQAIRTPLKFRGITYLGRTVNARDDVAFLHLVQRVVVDRQWVAGSRLDQYISDLHQLASTPDSHLLIYDRGRGAVAAALGPNHIPEFRLGRAPHPYLFMVYSADRSSIITGYQVSGIDQIDVSDGPLWLT